jgi:hypothetical protein
MAFLISDTCSVAFFEADPFSLSVNFWDRELSLLHPRVMSIKQKIK